MCILTYVINNVIYYCHYYFMVSNMLLMNSIITTCYLFECLHLVYYLSNKHFYILNLYCNNNIKHIYSLINICIITGITTWWLWFINYTDGMYRHIHLYMYYCNTHMGHKKRHKSMFTNYNKINFKSVYVYVINTTNIF